MAGPDDAVLHQVQLDVADGEVAVVKDRGGEHRVGTGREGLGDMLGRMIGTARGDHRQVHGMRHRSGERAGRSPARVPSRSQEVSRISPGPALARRLAPSRWRRCRYPRGRP